MDMDPVDGLVADLVDSKPEPKDPAVLAELTREEPNAAKRADGVGGGESIDMGGVGKYVEGPTGRTSSAPDRVGSAGSVTGGGLRDSAGTAYDPAIHERDPATNGPKLTTDGKFRRKRGGGAKNKPSQVVAGSDEYRNLAAFVCTTVFGCSVKVFGPDWEPTDGERAGIEQQAAATLEYYECASLPPPFMLLIAVGMYAGPRWNPECAAKCNAFLSKIGFRKKKPPAQTSLEYGNPTT